MKWPTFLSVKQASIPAANIYFERVNKIDNSRREETIALSREGRLVVAIGVAGTGKSAELNSFLMKFISKMGETGWPKHVYFRFDKLLFNFSWDETENEVNVELVAFRVTLDNLYLLTLGHEKDSILFLELGEGEEDPLLPIPTYIALSNRAVFTVTKTMMKADATYMLIEPPNPDDVTDMAEFMHRHMKEASIFNE